MKLERVSQLGAATVRISINMPGSHPRALSIDAVVYRDDDGHPHFYHLQSPPAPALGAGPSCAARQFNDDLMIRNPLTRTSTSIHSCCPFANALVQ